MIPKNRYTNSYIIRFDMAFTLLNNKKKKIRAFNKLFTNNI
jgi:hypothetical protein